MAKINIVLLIVLFNVLSCLKLMRSLGSINEFISKIRSCGDLETIKKMKLVLGAQVAINFCRQLYPDEDCEALIMAYMNSAPSMTPEPVPPSLKKK